MISTSSTKDKTQEDSDILKRIATDDKTAVENCLDVYGSLVRGLAKKYCYTREDIEDAVQEIFIDIWKYAATFDAEKSPEINFIMLIARRRLIDRIRRANSRPQLCFADDAFLNKSNDDHKKLQLHIELKDALQGLERLKPQQKAIVQMAIFGGMSHQEISQTISMPIGTVKSQIRRGFKKIRSFIGVRS